MPIEYIMNATSQPWEMVDLTVPLGDWTGARFVIRSEENAPGGIALILGGLGEAEEKSNAALMLYAPEMFRAIVVAMHALRTYQYGNDARGPAESCADNLTAILDKITACGVLNEDHT
jgi:hypothetical protein